MTSHLQFMQQAIRLAKRGLYTTNPNPRVGCIIVNDGVVIGEGWHQHAGQAHAEVLALSDAGKRAKGASAYVTLEPCNHTGKTPPCTQALITAGIKEIYVAMQDPNPLVAGKGLEALKSEGISVNCGILEAQAKTLNPGFIKRMETGLPFVRIKLAMSIDGRTAMASGESQWITGDAARKDVHRLRARSSAVLTGINTVLHDNPSLNVRLTAAELNIDGNVNQPLRVVLDTKAQFPANAKMLNCEGETLVYVEHEKTALAHCEFITAKTSSAGMDLKNVIMDLAKREVNEIHVEAGSVLCGSLLKEKLVDEIVIYMAATIMGNDAKGLFALPEMTKMKDKINVSISDIRKVGDDMRITMLPTYD